MADAKSPLGSGILCANLTAYIFAILVTGLEYSMSQVVENNTGNSTKDCREQLVMTYAYILVNIASLMRISASCYMNLRYSQPFDECKKKFVIVFCSDEFINEMTMSDDVREDILLTKSRVRYENQHQYFK